MRTLGELGLDAWITDDYGQGPYRRRERSESLVYDMSTVLDEVDEHPPFVCPFCAGKVVWEDDHYRCQGECDEWFHADGTHWPWEPHK